MSANLDFSRNKSITLISGSHRLAISQDWPERKAEGAIKQNIVGV